MIFHSYVSLPEGNWAHDSAWMEFFKLRLPRLDRWISWKTQQHGSQRLTYPGVALLGCDTSQTIHTFITFQYMLQRVYPRICWHIYYTQHTHTYIYIYTHVCVCKCDCDWWLVSYVYSCSPKHTATKRYLILSVARYATSASVPAQHEAQRRQPDPDRPIRSRPRLWWP